jgi:hypothetical protein
MGWQADHKMYCSIYTSLLSGLNTKKSVFFTVTLCPPDLRPDLDASGYFAFAYMFGFP